MLYDAACLLNECVDAWRLAIAYVAKLPRVSPEVQAAFVAVWIESKNLPLSVGNRPVLARALRVLLPGGYYGPPLMLYRGTGRHERRRRLYGFSWTIELAVARKFAERWATPVPGVVTEGVILQTLAPPEAIMLIRQPEDYYDEEEVVADPFLLGKINVIERLRGGGGTR